MATVPVYEFLFADGSSFGCGTARWVPGRIVNGRERWGNQTDSGQNALSPGFGRWLARSATFPGIAAALGAQLGGYIAQRKGA